MKKNLLYLGLPLIFFLGVIYFVFFRPGSSTQGPTEVTPTPQTEEERTTLSGPRAPEKITVPVAGGEVTVNNFYKEAKEIIPEASSVVVESTTGYRITYYEPGHSFIVTLLSSPLQTARVAAEREFLSRLGINESEACRLIVSVGAPAWVEGVTDDEAAAQKEGLSFCP